ncbi:MAG: hypothetical protein AVDCRST_MAG72-1493, partial [uncultured Nocardioidaceae bacterium]
GHQRGTGSVRARPGRGCSWHRRDDGVGTARDGRVGTGSKPGARPSRSSPRARQGPGLCLQRGPTQHRGPLGARRHHGRCSRGSRRCRPPRPSGHSGALRAALDWRRRPLQRSRDCRGALALDTRRTRHRHAAQGCVRRGHRGGLRRPRDL